MINLFYFLIFVIGTLIGSFLNVVICRLETGEEIVKKRSHCPKCGQVLRWYDLMPLASFFILRGRCRYCREKISWQYPIVELATGLLFLLIYNLQFAPLVLAQDKIFSQLLNLQISQFLNLIFWFFIAGCLIIIFVYDLRHYLIPDRVIYSAIIITLIYRFFETWNFEVGNLLRISNLEFRIFEPFLIYLLSAVGAASFFLAIVLITKGKGMGIGDIKVAFLMGLLLGWPLILPALLLAFGSGAIVGLVLIFLGRKNLKSQIPFGPFLVAATGLALFCKIEILIKLLI